MSCTNNMSLMQNCIMSELRSLTSVTHPWMAAKFGVLPDTPRVLIRESINLMSECRPVLLTA